VGEEWKRKWEEGATLAVEYIVFDGAVGEARPSQLCPDLGISAKQNLKSKWWW
jgi:hypothetical protein